MMRPARPQLLGAGALAAILAVANAPAAAHPHVFVDGGVDFVFGEGRVLEALAVTWLFDEFETLYTLSALGLGIDATGGLDAHARQELVRLLGDWPDDFSGSAHLTVEGHRIELAWPTALDANLVDGRLELTFRRRLETPLALTGLTAEVGFYEATYFYAFSVTEVPEVEGDNAGCAARVIHFDPDTQLAALQKTLFELGREETPEMEDVGALFADRIFLRCD